MRAIIRIPGSTPYGFRLAGGDGDPVTVARVRGESKAEQAGLREADVILAINGISCQGLSYNSVFGLTEINDQELKLDVLRDENAQSIWRTSLSFLDGSVQDLSEHEVVILLKEKKKHGFLSLEPSSLPVLQLQAPKPKIKQSSLPTIAVVVEQPRGLLSTIEPRITSSQTSFHILGPVEVKRDVTSFSILENKMDKPRSFVTRVTQNLTRSGDSGSNIHVLSPHKPLTFEFNPQEFNKTHPHEPKIEQSFGPISKITISDANHDNPYHLERQDYSFQKCAPLSQINKSEPTFGYQQSYASISKTTTTENVSGRIINGENTPHTNWEQNYTQQTWTSPKLEHSDPNFGTNQTRNYDPSSLNKFPEDVRNFLEKPRGGLIQLNKERVESVQKMAPTNILRKYNIGPLGSSDSSSTVNKVEESQEFQSYEMKSPERNMQQNFRMGNSNEPKSHYEPFIVSSDYQSSVVNVKQTPSAAQSSMSDETKVYNPPAPPPLPLGGIHASNLQATPCSPSEFNTTLYSGSINIKESEKSFLKEKVQKAKDMALSVLSPANKNSRGQMMFYKRRAQSEKWTIQGPDPVDKTETPCFGLKTWKNTMPSFETPSKNFKFQSSNVTANQFSPPANQTFLKRVQPFKWSPFNSNPQAAQEISLGYCDL